MPSPVRSQQMIWLAVSEVKTLKKIYQETETQVLDTLPAYDSQDENPGEEVLYLKEKPSR